MTTFKANYTTEENVMSDKDTQQDLKAVSGGLDPATPVRLDELVDYAPGAVVSRTLAKSGAGTLTVFAFDAGEELSEHTAPFDAYVQNLDGKVELTIDGKAVHPAVGETVLMPANIPHAVLAVERFKMLLILIRG
jgi:quercetin dioxygenase-like cupin family protein